MISRSRSDGGKEGRGYWESRILGVQDIGNPGYRESGILGVEEIGSQRGCCSENSSEGIEN